MDGRKCLARESSTHKLGKIKEGQSRAERGVLLMRTETLTHKPSLFTAGETSPRYLMPNFSNTDSSFNHEIILFPGNSKNFPADEERAGAEQRKSP